ncbi:MAG: NADPH-dependent glutamate synthase [bacterium]
MAERIKIVPEKTKMPKRSIGERKNSFEEVALGYDEEMAVFEAKRCLLCKNPTCMKGCPVEIKIPDFIKKIAERDFKASIEIIKEDNSLPAICGRVCPQEDQCEKVCVLAKKYEPVGIGRLERFIADWEAEQNIPVKKLSPSGPKVAVVGSGPGGLTCAGDLAKMGYRVTIFEALHDTGGVLRYGIPEFRLPKRIINREVEYVKSLGVEIKMNHIIGRIFTIEELMSVEGYSAVFVASGAGLPNFMNIPGENLNGVYSANEFLTRVNLMRAYLFPEYDTPVRIGETVAVVGGGNVAMDSVRVSVRLGAKRAVIVYRRSENEMPARIEEIENAKEEGVEFILLTNPTRIIGDENGWVKGMECIRMELSEPDESGRRKPVPIEGSEFVLDCQTVIMAIGQSPNPLIGQTSPGLKIGKWGNIEVNFETFETSIPGVYAGGDIVTGAATVISAMGAGKVSARSIDTYIKSKGK